MKHGQILGIFALLLVCAVTVIPAMAAGGNTTRDAATDYYNTAVQLTANGDYTGAIALYDQALGSNTTLIRINDALLYTYQGKAYAQIQQGNYSDAITTLNDGLEEYPSDQILWNNKGFAQYNLGKYADAVTSYDQALASDGNYTGAMINKGDALVKLGKYEDAITTYNAALANDPGNNETATRLSDAKKAAASTPSVNPIILVIVGIVAAAGVAYYVTRKTPAGKKDADKPDKNASTKKNKK
ncbi:MAG: tetratricopeptide repeat protein [Methanoregula sp.]|jgi:tetratricopeptide (TPR) repeat protein